MKTLTLSILQFNTFVKNILDAEEFLSNIGVYGEVTNFKVSAGNAYFELKDSNAMLSCVKFGAEELDIKNGDLITVFGKVNFYIKSGRLNFVVSKVSSSGIGDLYKNYIELKNRLEREGLFREEIKKPIPRFSKRIGVVTSETGAVIRDIINVTRKKNQYTDLIVFPSKVQGVGAEDDICEGIKYFNTRDDIDVIIIARGGGSFEDLSPFNTEKIVREIYESRLPIISAVGHETDFSLCDFAADLRVPTPSVAAEVAVFDFEQEAENILQNADMIFKIVQRNLLDKKQSLTRMSNAISNNLNVQLIKSKNLVQNITQQIGFLMTNILSNKKSNLNTLTAQISKMSPLEILRSGYAVVESGGSRVVSVKNIEIGDKIDINLSDGVIQANVTNKGEKL